MRTFLFFLLNAFLLTLAILAIWQNQLVQYGLSQGKGQLTIIWKSRPINEVLRDKSLPDSLNQKLLLIAKIKKFTRDSLGFKDSKNYTTIYDQHGKSLLLVVTGCKPYSFEPKEWDFPVLGKVPYKGFFNKNKAILEAVNLRAEGYDVDIGKVSGWSTLGFLRDPILSNMLYNSFGNLSNLIIHELSHSTIYVKGESDFNENLANFIGNKGAEHFLSAQFGKDSPQMKEYITERKDEILFNKYVLNIKHKLDSLYKSGKPAQKLKIEKLRIILVSIAEIKKSGITNISRFKRALNKAIYSGNAFFMAFERYDSQQDNFEKELQQKFGGNLLEFIQFYKSKYPYL